MKIPNGRHNAMKLTEINFSKLKLDKKLTLASTQVMYLATPKKNKKALKEFIDHCNGLGYVPINSHSKWNEKKKMTEFIANAVFFGIDNAKEIKSIEVARFKKIPANKTP